VKGVDYKRKKKEYKEIYERKKKEENENRRKRQKSEERETEVWKIINKKRKRKKRINEGIRPEEWKEYFMSIIGGVEDKVLRGGKRRRNIRRGKEQEISKGEVRQTIRKLRDRKVMNQDEISGEAWRYEGKEVEEWV